jgi:hypothetical protein
MWLPDGEAEQAANIMVHLGVTPMPSGEKDSVPSTSFLKLTLAMLLTNIRSHCGKCDLVDVYTEANHALEQYF